MEELEAAGGELSASDLYERLEERDESDLRRAIRGLRRMGRIGENRPGQNERVIFLVDDSAQSVPVSREEVGRLLAALPAEVSPPPEHVSGVDLGKLLDALDGDG